MEEIFLLAPVQSHLFQVLLFLLLQSMDVLVHLNASVLMITLRHASDLARPAGSIILYNCTL